MTEKKTERNLIYFLFFSFDINFLCVQRYIKKIIYNRKFIFQMSVKYDYYSHK